MVNEVPHAVWHTQEGNLGPPSEGRNTFFATLVMFIRGLTLQLDTVK